MGDLERLHGHFTGLAIERRTVPFTRPTFPKIPAERFLARLVLQDDRSMHAFRFAVNHLFAPIPQRLVLGVPSFEHDVSVLHQARQLSGGALLFVTVTVFNDVSIGAESARLAETAQF